MIDCEIKIKWSSGFHLRPASEFVKLVSDKPCKVTVTHNGTDVDGKSILGLSMLAVPCNETIVVSIDGKNEKSLLKEIKEFFEKNED